MGSCSLCFTRAWQVPGLAHVLQRQLQGHVAAQPLSHCTGAVQLFALLHLIMMMHHWGGILLTWPPAGSTSMPLCCWPAQGRAVLLQERPQGGGTRTWEGPCGPLLHSPKPALSLCHCCGLPPLLPTALLSFLQAMLCH